MKISCYFSQLPEEVDELSMFCLASVSKALAKPVIVKHPIKCRFKFQFLKIIKEQLFRSAV